MKNFNLSRTLAFASLGAAMVVGLIAADHVDSPSVASTSSDIADFYAFEGADENSTVFAVTLQGPLTPGSATTDASFDENVMVEINIDNTGDFVEDLVIQALPRDGKMYFSAPKAPNMVGTMSSVTTNDGFTAVDISTGSTETVETTTGGMKIYAGARRDPFFLDFNRFNAIASGSVAPEGFLPPAEASDFFENLNVLSVVAEVPNSLLGTAPDHVAAAVGITGLPAAYNVWVTTKRKQ